MGTLNLNLDLFQPPKQNSVVLMRLVLQKIYTLFLSISIVKMSIFSLHEHLHTFVLPPAPKPKIFTI